MAVRSALPAIVDSPSSRTVGRCRSTAGSTASHDVASPTTSSPSTPLSVSAPAGASRPGPRAVSNAFFAQTASAPNDRSISDFIWTWGQFIDHDFGLTEGAEELLPIPVAAGDPFFDPFSTGTVIIPFRRALFDHATGTVTPRMQVNEITSYLDGSMVYGSDAARAAWLRTFSGGRLKVTWHHNWWSDRVHERMPRVRFGQIHLFNNYYSATGNNYCIRAGVEANILVENNYFENVDSPHEIDASGAIINADGNTYSGTTGATDESGTAFDPPYPYSLESPEAARTAIQGNAGPQ